MRHGAASRLAGPPTTGAELADPVTTSPGRASSQATHGVDRPPGPRYNIPPPPRRAHPPHRPVAPHPPPPTVPPPLTAPDTPPPGRASSQPTHGVHRPRGPRYNIAGSRLVSGHPRSRPPSRSPLQHRRVAP